MNEDPNWLYHDHLDLEELLDNAAAAAKRQAWDAVERMVAKLVDRLKGHMRIEEEVLFPAYEQVPGTPVEPTEALRNDHDAMVNWCRDLHYASQARNATAFMGSLQTLRDLLGRHDEKEERFFLPMAGHILMDQKEAILDRLKALGTKSPESSGRNWDF